MTRNNAHLSSGHARWGQAIALVLTVAIPAIAINTAAVAQPGDTCATAVTITNGVTGSDLMGFTPSGVASSCAPASNADRWYRYTATCHGVATVALCTDLIESNVAIAVYHNCTLANDLACSDTHPTCGGGPVQTALNASVSFHVGASQVYYIRVSAPQTPSGVFAGGIHVSCNTLPGNVCPGGMNVSEGTTFIGGLEGYLPSSGAAANASACAPGTHIDRWFRYTASCTGTARVWTCEDKFIDGFVSLAAFNHCANEFILGPLVEYACSNSNPSCTFFQNENAEITFPVEAGKKYYVRLASPTETFIHSLHISCNNCGVEEAGSCSSSLTGTPGCAWTACCAHVCQSDPFCCNNNWDSLCVQAANADCHQSCGSVIAGNCFAAHSSPHCNNAACCNAICAQIPSCCTGAWHSGCAALAAQDFVNCNVISLPGANAVPLGVAELSPLPGNVPGVIVDNLGSSGHDGVQFFFPNLQTQVAGLEAIVIPMLSQPNFTMRADVITSAMEDLEHSWPMDFVVSGSLTEILIALNVGSEWTVRVFNGDTLVHEGPHFGSKIATIGSGIKPADFRAFSVGSELSIGVRLENPVQLMLGPQQFPHVVGDMVVVTAEVPSGGSAGQDGSWLFGPITRLNITATGMPGFDVPSLDIVPASLCAGNCGGFSTVGGCYCDEECFAWGDCCHDVCDHCTLAGCGHCAGKCGGQAAAGCWCDDACIGFGDCCDDACAACNVSGCDSSCNSSCGGAAETCWCDSSCFSFNDCCNDVCTWCDELSTCTCPSDLDGNGIVNVFDLLSLLGAWGPCAGFCAADFDGSGTVNVFDLLQLLGAWGPCP